MKGRLLVTAGMALLLAMTVVSCVNQDDVKKARDVGWTNPPGASYVGDDTCLGCHEKQGKKFAGSWHGFKTDADAKEKINCERCHGAGSRHVDGDGDTRFIFKMKSDNCMNCHTEKKFSFDLIYHHPVKEGKMECASCHTIHMSAGKLKAKHLANDDCLKCHEQMRGPWVYEHEALKDGCTTCHAVHGSPNNKMLVENPPNLCLKCHFDTARHQAIGSYSHSTVLNAKERTNCLGCHSEIHGSNFSRALRMD